MEMKSISSSIFSFSGAKGKSRCKLYRELGFSERTSRIKPKGDFFEVLKVSSNDTSLANSISLNSKGNFSMKPHIIFLASNIRPNVLTFILSKITTNRSSLGQEVWRKQKQLHP